MKVGYRAFRKSLAGDPYDQWRRKYSPELRRFHNIHKGQDCFIIGNGPSLNKMDLTELHNFYSFGLNKIYLYDKCDLGITYMAAVNPLVVEQAKDKFEAMLIPVFVSYQNALGIIDDHPHIQRPFVRSAFGFGGSLVDELYEGGTVTFVAMQIAFAMGFNRVALIGVDHNFKQTGKPNSEQLMKEDDDNHFHPDYFKGMNWHLADLEANEISYSLAKYHFERDGRQIWDATLNGKLNVFEKKVYSEVLSEFKMKGRR